MTAWVFSFRRSDSASQLIWKSGTSAGTATSFAPFASAKGRYSGKKGAMATNSLSSTFSARMTAISAGAAPQVKKILAARISAPQRSLSSAATAARASGRPGAGV